MRILSALFLAIFVIGTAHARAVFLEVDFDGVLRLLDEKLNVVATRPTGVGGTNSLTNSARGTFFTASGRQLIEIDGRTLQTLRSVTISGLDIRSLASAPDDFLYAAAALPGGGGSTADENYLWLVEASKGTTLPIGPMGASAVQAMTVDRNGALYAWGYVPSIGTTLGTVNTASGRFQPIGGFTPFLAQSLAFAGGTLIGVDTEGVYYTVDRRTGEIIATLNEPRGVDVRGIAVVPLPPAMALIVVPLASLWALRRRARARG